MTERCIQIPEDRTQMWAGVVIWGFFGFFALIYPGVTAARAVAYGAVFGVLALVAYRAQRAAICVSSDAVLVRGLARDISYAWQEIAAFARGRSLVGSVIVVVRTDGRRTRCYGVAPGGLVGASGNQQGFDRALRFLNDMHEQQTRPWGCREPSNTEPP